MSDPFGDVLPDRTRDEEVTGWGDREHETGLDESDPDESDPDERLRREVPPHHG